jgi:LPXTG-motif cell wall-anchored protein
MMFHFRRKKSIALLLTVCFLFVMVMPGYAAGTEVTGNSLQDAREGIVGYYSKNKTNLSTWREVVALNAAGQDVSTAPWTIPDWKVEQLTEKSQPTDYAGKILGMLAAGENPKDVGGRNLVAELAAKQKDDGSFSTLINQTAWAVIALDKAGGDYDIGKAMEFLINKQTPDGGFALFGTTADPDITGDALVALAPHKDIAGVSDAINDAIECLKKMQLPNGGFASWGQEAPESAAAVIRGLLACGEKNITSGDWQKEEGNMIDALFSFQLEDGSFIHATTETKYNAMATEQALQAVAAMVDAGITYTVKTGQKHTSRSIVSIAIIGKDGESLYAPGEVTVLENGKWGLTAFGALEATGVSHEIKDSDYGPYLTSINGQAGDKNGGWMYTVNDESPLVGMHQYDIQDGDCIIVYNSTDWENPAPTWEELTGQTPPNSDPDPEPEPGKGTNIAASKALSELISYYKNNKTALNSWAEVVALRSAGVDLTDGSWQLPDWEIDELNEDSYATDYAGTIIGMLAVGQEPTDVDGRDLVQELVDRQNSDGSFGDWFNETIWSMIALDTAKAEYDVSAAVKYLRDQQLEDGGFALFGTDSDPDTTGMVLIALASHNDIEGVPAVIDKAIKCIEGLQEESGGFASWGEESAESAAAVIRGLVAVGVDPDTMAKNGNTVFAALMSYQLADKSFSHIIGGESDSMATSQALTAIGDMVNGNVFDRIRDSYAPGQFDPYPGSDPDTTPPGDLQDPDETTPAGDQQDENKEKTTLPKTGGENLPIYLAGAALLCAGALMVRRKQLNQK